MSDVLWARKGWLTCRITGVSGAILSPGDIRAEFDGNGLHFDSRMRRPRTRNNRDDSARPQPENRSRPRRATNLRSVPLRNDFCPFDSQTTVFKTIRKVSEQSWVIVRYFLSDFPG